MSQAPPSTAYIGLGANLGDRLQALRDALERVDALPGTRLDRSGVSTFYETEPWDVCDLQPAYFNAAARLFTRLSPRDLLTELLDIERALGRVRTHRGAARTIDLDLLFYDDLLIDSPDLRLPHPRLHERRYVLEPLADIAGELIHPILQRRVDDLARELAASGGGGRVVGLPPPIHAE